MTIKIIIIIAAFGYFIIMRFTPCLFWIKENLGLEDYAKWESFQENLFQEV